MRAPSLDIAMLEDWRDHYVNVVVSVMAFVGCLGLAASLSRVLQFGWLNIFFLHIVGSSALVCVFLFRNRLSTNAKCLALIAVSLIAGLAGTYFFGLAGTGVIYVLNSAIFAAMFINRGFALSIVFGVAVFIGVIGYYYADGRIHAAIDLDLYVKDYSSWIATILGPVLISSVLVIVVSSVRTSLLKTILQLEEVKAELKEAADHDPLTGLANVRKLHYEFDQIVENMRRQSDPYAVLVLDLDDFKSVNDQHGHMAADRLLQEIAARVQSSLRNSDVAARIGGDEFVILLRNIHQADDAAEIAGKLLNEINAPFQLEANVFVRQGVSIGGVIKTTHDDEAIEDCIKEADDAMYKLKAIGKNGFYFDDAHFFQTNLTDDD